ncbi:hypothetical protein [Streptomyces sp. NBC_00233]|uniref:hypothetical protein n=1 Tax=Streptomyces sp. NBC_00233 TaxID=2975686 RepID=UPI00224C9C0A|nr:hypothetical protein [Streptomyces sp. NBC_00233]MCX5225841.1 hypothetical protein [Streptomyces sp. NBC_00233]
MSRKSLPWFETLTDSVFALGAAARETRTAHQAAQAASAQYDLTRLRLLDGEVTVTGRFAASRPHDKAVVRIVDALSNCEERMAALYNQAALSYAYSTAWAILRVLGGQEPPRAEVSWAEDGSLNIPTELAPIPASVAGLERWSNNAKFERARKRWEACEYAAEYAAALTDEEYLSDHGASEMHKAYGEARGITDAAYAYGVLAEPALRYALLGVRARHANQ